MEQLGTALTLVIFAFAFGVVWNHILDRPIGNGLRIVGYPLMGMIFGEGLWAKYMVAGPEFLGVHIVVAILVTFTAVFIDALLESRGEILPFNGNRTVEQSSDISVVANAEG